ncbi:MAG: UDP-N-acetylmuramoyl-tripeptide--D-alanyl-D-alanine ligase [Flavobacteriales bacterium]|nr:UDP-N-acetylmuramoyl-tripeptide--D-alanyl-D-alanine ligase [Flavobacteriales bacterium]
MTIQELHHLYLECSGACTDTRAIRPGCMFFALKGPSFDANAFAADALSKGARFAVVDDAHVVKDDRCLLVPDVLIALQVLARQHRRMYKLPVIGITGSNGKTTTKELLAAVLGTTFPTLSTTGNLNNHIGVPLTLLHLNKQHRMAIIEMGANKPGDIAELCAIAEPTHGLITNIGKAHLEGFGDFEGVLRTKSELFEFVRAGKGLLFVNADDPLLMQRAHDVELITYGTGATSDTCGRMVDSGPFLRIAFKGRDGLAREATTHLIGSYNLPNALAAISVGQHFDVPDDRITDALSAYQPGNNRSQFLDSGRNHLVLDAYNANPTSMAAALDNFANMHSERPKLAILGDMLELGSSSPKEHHSIAERVANLGVDVFFVGPRFKAAIGNSGPRAYVSAADLLADLRAHPVAGHLILLKGSRGMQLESLLPAF